MLRVTGNRTRSLINNFTFEALGNSNGSSSVPEIIEDNRDR